MFRFRKRSPGCIMIFHVAKRGGILLAAEKKNKCSSEEIYFAEKNWYFSSMKYLAARKNTVQYTNHTTLKDSDKKNLKPHQVKFSSKNCGKRFKND